MSRYVGCLLLLSMALLMAGCGGGGGADGSTDDPSVPLMPDRTKLLKGAGLTLTLVSDKDTYQAGEVVHYWLSVHNDGSQARTLQLRHPHDIQAMETYRFAVSGIEDPAGKLTWQEAHYDVMASTVQPGETITLLNCVWNQKTSSGDPASAGFHRVGFYLMDLLVDGKRLWPDSSYDAVPFYVDLDKGIDIR